jgi:molecular chaperone Hsp33
LSSDQIHAFSFDGAPVRGRLVKLTRAWQQIRSRHGYAPAAERLLGELVAIVAMLAQGIKLDGSVILQIRGEGLVRTAMAECSDRTTLRGILRTDESLATAPIHVGGKGQLAITLKPHRGEMYQGIVPLETDSVPRAVETYFQSSEQLPTRVWAVANGDAAAGMFLQRLPDTQNARPESLEHTEESWRRLLFLADTVSEPELLTVPTERLLLRLFHAESVRLQPPLDLQFGCSCSRERTANALRIMGRAEIDEILAQEGRIDVTCEFCGEEYGYDPIDARLLFEPLALGLPATPQ